MKKELLLPVALLCGLGTIHAQYTDLLNFNMANGYQPYGSVIVSGNTLYGMTSEGGVNNDGLIFSMDVNGANYSDLHDFSGPDGKDPQGSLILLGHRLFGMTELGGSNPSGTIFAINTDGSGFKQVFNFVGDYGFYPYGSLTLSGNKLYGMTNLGGSNGIGNIFSIDTGGGNVKDLLDFDGTHPPYGSFPQGSLIISGKSLYGMTMAGGPLGNGIIFSIDTNGTGFTDLFDFHQTDGESPRGSLTISENVLYGLAGGGANIDGVIFSLHTDGTGFTDLLNFNGTDGTSPLGDLTLSGNILYGFTDNGGANNDGLIFSIDTNGNGYSDLYDFSYPTGINPWGGALALQGNTLYGMTEYGGANIRDGVVFRFKDTAIAVPPPAAFITGFTNVLCNGGNNGTATVSASGGTQPYTYSWMPAGGTNATGTGLMAGIYTVIVIDNSANTVTCSATIFQPARLLVVAQAMKDTICAGSNTVITANTSGGVQPYTFSWRGGALSSGETVSPSISTCYTVTVTDNNSCAVNTTICVIVKTCTGIEELAAGSEQWSVFPDPSSGIFSIRSRMLSGAETTISVYTVFGEKVYSSSPTLLPQGGGGPSVPARPPGWAIRTGADASVSLVPSFSYIVNISSQPNGVYFYRVVGENGEMIGEGKVVIQK